MIRISCKPIIATFNWLSIFGHRQQLNESHFFSSYTHYVHSAFKRFSDERKIINSLAFINSVKTYEIKHHFLMSGEKTETESLPDK